MSEAQPTSAAAIIECILRRPPHGTKIELDGKTIHFKPDADGRETAVVDDPEHIARLLSIPEAYRLSGVASKEPNTVPMGIIAPVTTPTLTQGADPAPQNDAKGPETTPPVTTPATIEPGTAAPPQSPLDHDGDGKAGGSLPKADEPDAVPADLINRSLDDLRAVFQAEVGRKPNDRAKPETLIAQIVARRKELAGA